MDHVKADFYNRMDSPFRRWLYGLAPETDSDDELMNKREQWRHECVNIARELGNEIIRQAGTAAIFGRTKSGSGDDKKSETFSAASAMNRFLSELKKAEER